MLVGQGDAADRAGVKIGTISAWRKRSATFPAPLVVIGLTPCWWWPEIEAWIDANRRSRNIVPADGSAPQGSGAGFPLGAASNLPASLTDPKNAAAFDAALAPVLDQAEVLGVSMDLEPGTAGGRIVSVTPTVADDEEVAVEQPPVVVRQPVIDDLPVGGFATTLGVAAEVERGYPDDDRDTAEQRAVALDQLQAKIDNTTATTAAHCRHKRKRRTGSGLVICDDCGQANP